LPGVADEILVQVSYAIGVAKPMGILSILMEHQVNLTNGEIAKKLNYLRYASYFIEQRLKLKKPDL
jgi:S-adenosylmethionine synthetase